MLKVEVRNVHVLPRRGECQNVQKACRRLWIGKCGTPARLKVARQVVFTLEATFFQLVSKMASGADLGLLTNAQTTRN